MDDAWRAQVEGLGAFIRGQRQLANLSLRELAALTNLSNAYLSQVERGLHEPSVRVLKSVASALNVSAETLLSQAGLLEEDGTRSGEERRAGSTEETILADPALSEAQRQALLSVYRSFLADGGR